jgi:TctA family transporter
MVAWVSGRRGWVELAVAAGYALGLWALLTGLYSAGALLAFSALTYGISQAHFLIDGEVWHRRRIV